MASERRIGIDDKRRLLGFFAAKNHVNLVLRVVDVLELRHDLQDYLIAQCVRVAETSTTLLPPQAVSSRFDAPDAPMTRKQWLLREFPRGWVVLPIDQVLGPMELQQVVRLQEVVYTYTDVRRQKGEPCRVDPCDKCNGVGQLGGRRCKDCDGGQVITFIEMSPEERAMAEGEA